MMPCLYFLKGACRFGSFCRNAHIIPPTAATDSAAEVFSAVAASAAGPLPFHLRHTAFKNREETAPLSGAPDQPPPRKLRIMSYNILADTLAYEHAKELYKSSPHHCLKWRHRCQMLLREVEHLNPDVVCLQEVDCFGDIDRSLKMLGYSGKWTKRTGDRKDGLATFYKQNILEVVEKESLHFNRLGLKDNVAQLTTLKWLDNPTQSSFIVANIHVLFNPKRGDMKVAQVRTLFEKVHAVQSRYQKHSSTGMKPPAIICGDFNTAAGSAIYDFICAGQLDMSQHDRRTVSGQVEGTSGGWRSHCRRLLGNENGNDTEYQGGEGVFVRAKKPSKVWTRDEILIAKGKDSKKKKINNDDDGGIDCTTDEDNEQYIIRHPLQLASAYKHVLGSEPLWTTCHDGYVGTVDFVFFTKDTDDRLQPVSALHPPRLETLSTGLPSVSWPSDHISLIVDFTIS